MTEKIKERKRSKLAKQAIVNNRKRVELDASKPSRSWQGAPGIAHGCVGLIDYILTGDPQLIMDPTLRQEVQKLIG